MKQLLILVFATAIWFDASAIAAPKEFTDQDFARACAEVLDNSDTRKYWDQTAEGLPVRLSFTAARLSRSDGTLAGESEFTMGARVMPVRAGIDITSALIPDGLKKGDRIVVSGKVTFAAFWGNVFEGCYLNIEAKNIILDGF